MMCLHCCVILYLAAACLSLAGTTAVTDNETSASQLSCKQRLDNMEREMQHVIEVSISPYKDKLDKLEKAMQHALEISKNRLDKLEESVQRITVANQWRPEITRPLFDTKPDSSTPAPDLGSAAKRSDDFGSLGPVVEAVSGKVTQLEATVTALQQTAEAQGSVYVRWGRTACPDHTDTVYAGTVGGSLWSDHGSGSDLLCLPPNPVYDDMPLPTSCGPSTIYGAEYEVCPQPHHNMDVVCALCRSPRSTVMIPATSHCPNGWTTEYTGHLMSGFPAYAASTDYICVDASPQDRPGGQANQDGTRLYYTVSRCGSLPCPPYQNNKILSCVVCSR